MNRFSEADMQTIASMQYDNIDQGYQDAYIEKERLHEYFISLTLEQLHRLFPMIFEVMPESAYQAYHDLIANNVGHYIRDSEETVIIQYERYIGVDPQCRSRDE